MLTESLVVVAPIMAPVFVVAAIGFGWARAGMPFDTEFTTSLVSNLAFPCLIVATLAKLEVDPAAFSQMAWAGVLTVLATGAIAAVVLKAFGRSQPVYWPPLVFGNVGNMGLPLCLFAFGEEGLSSRLESPSPPAGCRCGRWLEHLSPGPACSALRCNSPASVCRAGSTTRSGWSGISRSR
jgi:hypothetical protein